MVLNVCRELSLSGVLLCVVLLVVNCSAQRKYLAVGGKLLPPHNAGIATPHNCAMSALAAWQAALPSPGPIFDTPVLLVVELDMAIASCSVYVL